MSRAGVGGRDDDMGVSDVALPVERDARYASALGVQIEIPASNLSRVVPPSR